MRFEIIVLKFFFCYHHYNSLNKKSYKNYRKSYIKESFDYCLNIFFCCPVNVELFQNLRPAATSTQCNDEGEGSVCRCCCFFDECGKQENCTGK